MYTPFHFWLQVYIGVATLPLTVTLMMLKP